MNILKKKAPRRAQSQNQHNSNITKETRQESYLARPIRKDEILDIMGDEELTARQILIKSKYSDMNSIRPRLTEMKDEGLVEVVGKALDLATNRNVAVFRKVEE